MAVPRYRGYGFRNIGGWKVRDNCAKAGRNLNIVSAGVLLYLISGARVESLSVRGAIIADWIAVARLELSPEHASPLNNPNQQYEKCKS